MAKNVEQFIYYIQFAFFFPLWLQGTQAAVHRASLLLATACYSAWNNPHMRVASHTGEWILSPTRLRDKAAKPIKHG